MHLYITRRRQEATAVGHASNNSICMPLQGQRERSLFLQSNMCSWVSKRLLVTHVYLNNHHPSRVVAADCDHAASQRIGERFLSWCSALRKRLAWTNANSSSNSSNPLGPPYTPIDKSLWPCVRHGLIYSNYQTHLQDTSPTAPLPPA